MRKPSKKLLDLAIDITGERELEEFPKLLKLYTYALNMDIEIERLNHIIEEIREYVKHKIVECYDEGSTIGEFYKICDIDSKIEELLHKGEDKE